MRISSNDTLPLDRAHHVVRSFIALSALSGFAYACDVGSTSSDDGIDTPASGGSPATGTGGSGSGGSTSVDGTGGSAGPNLFGTPAQAGSGSPRIVGLKPR